MYLGVLVGEGTGKLKVGFNQFAFFAGTVDADDPGGRGGGKEGKEVGDEARADVIAEGNSIF